MTETKEYRGMWFLPDKPDIKVAGVLYFYPNEKIKLELIGSLCEFDKTVFVYPKETFFPVIHGIVYGENNCGEKITLFDCYLSWKYSSKCGFPLANYSCTYMLVGGWLNSENDKLFDKIQVFFPCLLDWYEYHSIDLDIRYDFHSLKIPQEQRYKKTFSIIDEQTKLILNSFASLGTTEKGYEILENAYVEIENSVKTTFTELYHKISLFNDFLSMAILTDISVSNLILFENREEDTNPIRLFFITKKHSTNNYPIHNYLFRFKDIESVFPDIIKKWYSESETLEPIRRHFISSLTYKRTFTSIDFLIVIQAIEGYYYRFVEDGECLKTLLINLYDKFQDIPKIQDNRIEILEKVVDSRHYYSHFFDKNKKQNICNEEELFEITSKLQLLLIGCILSLVGFEHNQIEKFLKNKMRYR